MPTNSYRTNKTGTTIGYTSTYAKVEVKLKNLKLKIKVKNSDLPQLSNYRIFRYSYYSFFFFLEIWDGLF